MNISLNLGAIHKLRNPPRGREVVTEMIILDYGGGVTEMIIFDYGGVFCITGSCSLTSMLAAGALLVLRIVPHSARSQTLQARSFLGMLGPFLCTPCVRGQEVHSAHSIKPKICRTLSSEMFQSLTQSCKTR